MRHQESKLQRECVEWFHNHYKHHILFAIPNGGYRSKIEAAIMKGEGVLAGTADLFLVCAACGFNGLFIELKTPKGRQTEKQKEFAWNVQKFGYGYIIVRSKDEFKKLISNYLYKTIE